MRGFQVAIVMTLAAGGTASALALQEASRSVPDDVFTTVQTTLFEGARIISGDGSAPIENGAFLIEGDRISTIGKTGEMEVPSSAIRVDLGGKTVMPALIDLHSHIGYEHTPTNTQAEDNWSRENVLDHLDRYAYTGHALTVSLGSDRPNFIDRRYSEDPKNFVDLRDESTQDHFTGARYLTSGRALAWPGTNNPRSTTPYMVVSPWSARLAVRELASQKVAVVKLWVEDRRGYINPVGQGSTVPGSGKSAFYLGPELYRPAIEEAHRYGLRVVAHVKSLELLKDIVLAGLDAQTHRIDDLPLDEELLTILGDRPHFRNIPVLTPATQGGSAPRAPGERPAWLRDPLLGAIKCPAHLESWGKSFERSMRVPTPTGGLQGENTAALYRAGVRMLLGSHDAGGNRPLGWGSHMELEGFVNWVGMTPHEAIVAATSGPAEFLGVDDHLGTIRAGKGADFIVLDANPLEDITNTRRISDVYLRGKRVDRETMEARWHSQCIAAGAG